MSSTAAEQLPSWEIDWASIERGWFENFAPPPEFTISQWADAERKLSSEASAEPGQWHTDRAEYLRGVMDAIGDPEVGTVVLMSSSQIGKSESLLNAIGYYVAYDPSPILIVQPTLEMAEAFSKDRLAPMFRDTPALARKVPDTKSRDSQSTIRHRVFPGGHVTISGSNSPASLASRPIRIVMCDEVDRYEPSAGAEGDPISLAFKRSVTFWNRKLVLTSTPTIKGFSRIEQAFEESDKRRFWVPCPECGEMQVLRWAQVSWDKDLSEDGKKTRAHHPETAHYVCEYCGSLWDDVARWSAVKRGKWRAEREFNGVAGFHLNEIYSSWVKLADMVRGFIEAKDDSHRLQTWVNTSLGESWEEAGEGVSGGPLMARRENYGPESLPDTIALLTAGVDVQGDRLELQVFGFGAREEAWVADYAVIYGDPAQADVWMKLDRLLARPYRTVSGCEPRIAACCIDTGGHHSNQVQQFCGMRRARNIYPTKGLAGPRPIWPRTATRSGVKGGAQIFLLGVDTAKDTIYGRLRIREKGPGYVHFPLGDAFDAEYFAQLTSERVVTRFRMGRPYRVWELPSGRHNEVLDTAILALAARHSLPVRLDLAAVPPPSAPSAKPEIADTQGDTHSAFDDGPPPRVPEPMRPVIRSSRFEQRQPWMRGRKSWWE